ncbi:esterase/lipase family protein [Cellvibrio mixtus]|uniref:esterase/lipase family protein n=1 Tax=Cellvibrio mixtus TaxID=39650 RepID=UPI000A9251E4|nr:alpha/beta hydrolase [Cellvibrio mixtus]
MHFIYRFFPQWQLFASVQLFIALVAGLCSPLAQADTAAQAQNRECVILLHGLARTSKSMQPLADALTSANYIVVNQDYPSRKFPIAELAMLAIPQALSICRQQSLAPIHFITHSLGGILLRHYLSINTIPELGRVVMFAPPNKGSQVVDKLKNVPGFMWMNGPAGQELGTNLQSVPLQLGPVTFDLGIIAGTRSINWILSLYLPNPDDGKVSVENTKVEGMHDFIALPISHPFIMKDKTSIRQSLHYLQQGHFLHDEDIREEQQGEKIPAKKLTAK